MGIRHMRRHCCEWFVHVCVCLRVRLCVSLRGLISHCHFVFRFVLYACVFCPWCLKDMFKDELRIIHYTHEHNTPLKHPNATQSYTTRLPQGLD